MVAAPAYPSMTPSTPASAPAQSLSWTSEQLEDAKKKSIEYLDQPLNDTGSHRVRVNTFGSAGIGIDLREFMQGQFGDATGKWLPSKKGFRLRPQEWEMLKAVSGDIDHALAKAGYVPPPPPPSSMEGPYPC